MDAKARKLTPDPAPADSVVTAGQDDFSSELKWLIAVAQAFRSIPDTVTKEKRGLPRPAASLRP